MTDNMFENAYIDFDDTIYDTRRLSRRIFEVLRQAEMPESVIREACDEAVQGKTGTFFDYTYERHLSLLAQRGFCCDKEFILRRLYLLTEENFQFPDAEAFLLQVKSLSRKVHLLTAGNEAFQLMKIKSTALFSFFDEIKILHEKKEEYIMATMDNNKRQLFVNDNLTQNMTVSTLFPNVSVVTMVHPKYSQEEIHQTGLPNFRTLTEISSYVASSVA